jgi:hypothetical protein
MIPSSHHACDLVYVIGGARSIVRGINVLKDVAKWMANHAHNKAKRARNEKEKAQNVAHRVAKERGEDTPT